MSQRDGGSLLRQYMDSRAGQIGREGTGVGHTGSRISAGPLANAIKASWRQRSDGGTVSISRRTIENHSELGSGIAVAGDEWWLIVSAYLFGLDESEADELLSAKRCPTVAELRIRHRSNAVKSDFLETEWPSQVVRTEDEEESDLSAAAQDDDRHSPCPKPTVGSSLRDEDREAASFGSIVGTNINIGRSNRITIVEASPRREHGPASGIEDQEQR